MSRWVATKYLNAPPYNRRELADKYMPKKKDDSEHTYTSVLDVPRRIDITDVSQALLCKCIDGVMYVTADKIADDVTHVIYRDKASLPKIMGWIETDDVPVLRSAQFSKMGIVWKNDWLLTFVLDNKTKFQKEICKKMYENGLAVMYETSCEKKYYTYNDIVPFNPHNYFLLCMDEAATELYKSRCDKEQEHETKIAMADLMSYMSDEGHN